MDERSFVVSAKVKKRETKQSLYRPGHALRVSEI
jgi:hypothetical protein